jgi:hypothetical protein
VRERQFSSEDGLQEIDPHLPPSDNSHHHVVVTLQNVGRVLPGFESSKVGSSAMAKGDARHTIWAKPHTGAHSRWPNGDFTSFLLGKSSKTARRLLMAMFGSKSSGGSSASRWRLLIGHGRANKVGLLAS